MRFIDDINRAVENIQRQADARVRKVSLAALQEIDAGSPIDKGTFAANWVVSFDIIDRTFDLSKTKKDIAKTLSKASVMIASGAKCGTTVFISNSVPYANKIEDGYGGKQHVQKPEGVVAPAITKIKNAIESGRL